MQPQKLVLKIEVGRRLHKLSMFSKIAKTLTNFFLYFSIFWQFDETK